MQYPKSTVLLSSATLLDDTGPNIRGCLGVWRSWAVRSSTVDSWNSPGPANAMGSRLDCTRIGNICYCYSSLHGIQYAESRGIDAVYRAATRYWCLCGSHLHLSCTTSPLFNMFTTIRSTALCITYSVLLPITVQWHLHRRGLW